MRRSGAVTARVLVACAVFALGACVSQDDPGLTVQALSTDIAFGVEVEEPAGPPTAEPSEQLPSSAADGGFEPPQLQPFDPNEGLPPLPPVRSEPVQDCPDAPRGAAAERVATENVTEMPVEGLYRWKREGTQTIVVAETGDTVEVPIGGFEKRIVRNVTEVSDTSFSYEVVAPLLDREAVSITTYLVETDPEQVQPGGLPVIEEPRANEPEGGVSIQRVVIEESDGTESSSFDPSTGLLLLGLPVISGEQYQSSSVDPRSGQSIVHDAEVLGRERIDACGDVVDGWRVEAQQTRSDAAGPVTFNYLVAPQYGGLVISEEITRTNDDGSEIEITYTLGQVEPDPLPESQNGEEAGDQ